MCVCVCVCVCVYVCVISFSEDSDLIFQKNFAEINIITNKYFQRFLLNRELFVLDFNLLMFTFSSIHRN